MRPIDLDEIEFIKADGNEEFNHGVDCCINTLLKAPTLKVIKEEVLDKIRAEILNFREKCNASDYLGCGILEIIDKYKAESEE